MHPKKSTTYQEQLELIREKGFLITQQEEISCIKFLKRVNYYRISAYFLPFRQKDGSYFLHISFSRIQKIYEFDSQLRGLIFSTIEDIEVNIRSILSYFSAHKYGSLGYLSPDMFSARHNSAKFQEKLYSCINENLSAISVFPQTGKLY